MQLSPKQIQELTDLIDVQVDGFIARHLSPSYLTKIQLDRLAKYGIKIEGQLTVDMAFKLGMLSDMIGRKSMTMTMDEMIRELKAKNYLPLGYAEKKALERIRYNSFNEIKGLGNKWSSDLRKIIIEGDKKRRASYQKDIKDTALEAIQNRKDFRWMASELGHKTQDWTRDFDRMSDFILHDAHDHGRAYDLLKRDGEGAEVYKHVFDQACKHCVRLYLTGGAFSKPKVFKVTELLANGTNVGRKVADWKPVIGATHPWCRCELQKVFPNSEWDEKDQRFKVVLNERARKIKDIMERQLGTP